MTSPTNDRRTQLQLERDKIQRRVEAMPSTTLCVDRADSAVS